MSENSEVSLRRDKLSHDRNPQPLLVTSLSHQLYWVRSCASAQKNRDLTGAKAQLQTKSLPGEVRVTDY